MTKTLHPTLARQLRKFGMSRKDMPTSVDTWNSLLDRISSAYRQSDEDRYTLERSLDISSKEMSELYESLRRSSEGLLAKEKDKLQTIVSNLGDGLCVTSEDGTISSLNNAASKMLERAPDDVIGRQFTSFVIDGCKAHGMNQVALSDLRQKKEGEAKIIGGTKGLIPIHYTITPLRSTTFDLVIGSVIIFRDISQQKKVEIALKEARDNAIEASQLKSDFLANMSHEIRTPLNVVLGSAELLSYSDLTEEQLEDVETIQESIQQLKEIIDEVLDFSKIEAGKIFIDNKAFSLETLTQNLLTQAQKLSKNKGLEIKMDFNQEVPSVLVGDSLRIRQVALNLLSNAIKFTPTGGTVGLSIDFEASENEEIKLIVAVTDTGLGIEPDKLEIIFDKFSQADNSVTREFGGTGLGLAICSGLVRLMNGEIWVNSVVGEGSVFSFSIPLTVAHDEIADKIVKNKKQVNKDSNLKSLRILLAEDNVGNQQTVTRLLEMYGHSVVIANNGQEAIDTLIALHNDNNFDVVLMDLHMPKLGGLDAAEHIRASESNFAEIPIIALTAHAIKGVKDECLSRGMNGYVSKPIDYNYLFELLSEVTNSRV